MKLNELVTEAKSDVYLAQIKNGGAFNVTADSLTDARAKAKAKLRSGQVLDSVVKDRQNSQSLEDKKAKLVAYVDNDRNLQRSPSQQKTFKRQIERATTPSKLQDVSDAISNFGEAPKKEEKEDKSEKVDEGLSLARIIKQNPIHGNHDADSKLLDLLHDVIADKSASMMDRRKAMAHMDKVMGEEQRDLPTEKEINDYLAAGPK